MKRFWKEYQVEVTVLALVVLGVILLVGPFGIKDLLRGAASGSSSMIKDFFQSVLDRLFWFVIYLTVWDAVGVLLIVGPILYLFYRIRHRYLTSAEASSRICPQCGSSLERVHRSLFDRLLGKTLMPKSRRYRCTSQSCKWSGLRR